MPKTSKPKVSNTKTKARIAFDDDPKVVRAVQIAAINADTTVADVGRSLTRAFAAGDVRTIAILAEYKELLPFLDKRRKVA